MAEWRDPGTPEKNLSWRNEPREGRGSPSNRQSGRSRGSSRRGDRASESESWRFGDGRRMCCVKIPEDRIGRLIGRQGCRIKGLEDATRTRIDIRRGDRSDEASIFISGPYESREKCKDLIVKFIKEESNESDEQQIPEEERTEEERPEEERPEEERTEEERTEENQNGEQSNEVDWDAIRRKSDEQEKQRLARLPRFRKYFYVEAQEIAEMCDEDVEELRRSLNNITATFPFGGSGKIPNPVETFEQAFAFYPKLLDLLRSQRFRVPFPIQCQAWPVLLSGHDMIGIAQTGTGKTLAFLLPALIHIDGQDPPLSEREGPNVLILAPTRELALQIDGEVKKFPYFGIRSACVYGGVEREEHFSELRQGVNMVIGTPGRVNDCVSAKVLNLKTITYIVLDEADRMLDLGFERQIRKVLLALRPDKQTIMTSATWPRGIQSMAKMYMRDPVKILIGSRDLTAVHSVVQTVYIVEEKNKYDLLMEVIQDMSPTDKMIVFVGRRAIVDSISSDLALERIECQSIHGNRDQSDREEALEDFRTSAVRILVATDVASRGLDIEDVTKVLNFDFPKTMEEYVHRVGRTGRAGKTGEAITFFTKANESHAEELIAILEEAGQIIPDELREISWEYENYKKSKSSDHQGRGRRRPRH